MKGQDGIAALGIGPRNVEMTKQMLTIEGIKVAASDVGGNCGRSLKFECVSSGTLTVKGSAVFPRFYNRKIGISLKLKKFFRDESDKNGLKPE